MSADVVEDFTGIESNYIKNNLIYKSINDAHRDATQRCHTEMQNAATQNTLSYQEKHTYKQSVSTHARTHSVTTHHTQCNHTPHTV